MEAEAGGSEQPRDQRALHGAFQRNAHAHRAALGHLHRLAVQIEHLGQLNLAVALRVDDLQRVAHLEAVLRFHLGHAIFIAAHLADEMRALQHAVARLVVLVVVGRAALQQAPGVELHILEKGEGKPLVFIPGLTFSGEIFKNQLEYFSSEYRVIAIDPRGQGYSAKTVDGNDYLTHGRDVAGLIDALGLKDIVLIGWSTGNLDTWSYVQQFGKDKLRGVVTIDMSPLPLSPDPKWWTEGTIEELSGRHTGVDFF